MSLVAIVLIAAFVVGAAIGIYALIAPRRRAELQPSAAPPTPLAVAPGWNESAAAEFDALSEAAKCDMVFAVAALEDERSAQLLRHALDDPSEAVALAAARAMRERGLSQAVDDYLARTPGDRAERIAQTLALLAPEP